MPKRTSVQAPGRTDCGALDRKLSPRSWTTSSRWTNESAGLMRDYVNYHTTTGFTIPSARHTDATARGMQAAPGKRDFHARLGGLHIVWLARSCVACACVPLEVVLYPDT